MNLKDYFDKEFYLKLADVLVEEIVFPAAEEYVKSTENKYDDSALEFLKEFWQDFRSR